MPWLNLCTRESKIAKAEISRLKNDTDSHSSEIEEKENELDGVRKKLESLSVLLEDHELLCPECKAPLLQRHFHTIFGIAGGREMEADIEIVEYECGLVLEEGKADPSYPCKNTKQNQP